MASTAELRAALLDDQAGVLGGLLSGGHLRTREVARLCGCVDRTARKWASGERLMPFDAVVALASMHSSAYVRDALYRGLMLARSGRITVDPGACAPGAATLGGLMREAADVVDAYTKALMNDGRVGPDEAEVVCEQLDEVVRVAYAMGVGVRTDARRGRNGAVKKPAKPAAWMKRMARETAERAASKAAGTERKTA